MNKIIQNSESDYMISDFFVKSFRVSAFKKVLIFSSNPSQTHMKLSSFGLNSPW